MSTNERVKAVRKELKITMDSFGTRLGVTRTAISNIESGNRGLTDQMCKSICREFNVSEEWLRTGKGSMFQQNADDYISQKCRERGFSKEEEEILRLLVDMFLRMSPDERAYLKSNLIRICGNADEIDIDMKVESYRQELENEKEAQDVSGASQIIA